MFSPKISQDRASLEILENKSVKTLSKTDQDIFIRDYFWTMTNHLSCIIDESYLKFQNDDKAQSFFTALYKIRKQPDSKDILASIAIFEKNMQYVFDSVDATVKKHGDIYGLLNIDNFCLNLGLMIKNLHPKKNIEHLFTLLPHSPDAMADSKYQFHLRRKMLDNPLDRVLQLEKRKLKDKIILFLINHESYTMDELYKDVIPELSQWMTDYPRLDHAEVFQLAVENGKKRRYFESPQIEEMQAKLLEALDELKKLNSPKKTI